MRKIFTLAMCACAMAASAALPTPGEWYTLTTTKNTPTDRFGKVMVVLDGGSGQNSYGIANTSGTQPAAGMLWTADYVPNDDAQLWSFVLDPDGSGKYAMINKAYSGKSVATTCSATANTGRWSLTDGLQYGFTLTEDEDANGSNVVITGSTGQPLNHAGAGQGYSINPYNANNAGKQWRFAVAAPVAVVTPEAIEGVVNVAKGESATVSFTLPLASQLVLLWNGKEMPAPEVTNLTASAVISETGTLTYYAAGQGMKSAQQSIQVKVEGDTGEATVPTKEDVLSGSQWFRLNTRFNGPDTQPRYGACIELVSDARVDAVKASVSGLNNANIQADRLWHAKPADASDDHYDYQWFKFEKDPNGDHYAMVCKAAPNGSVNATPSVNLGHNSSRFDYDHNTKHYGFYLVDTYKGSAVQGADENGFYSAITSANATAGWYMNISAAGQAYSVHMYTNPTDQNAGIFTFEPHPGNATSIAEVVETPAAEGIFDLSGRRLSAPVKGINIINGRKVLVK